MRAARLPEAYVADAGPLAPAAARDPIAVVGNDVVSRTGRAHHPVAAAAVGNVDLVRSRSWECDRGALMVDDPVVAGAAETRGRDCPGRCPMTSRRPVTPVVTSPTSLPATRPLTSTGTELFVLVSSPSCPEELAPQHLTAPELGQGTGVIAAGADRRHPPPQSDHVHRHQAPICPAVAQLPGAAQAPALDPPESVTAKVW